MDKFFKIVAGSFFIFFLSWLFVFKIGVNSLAIQSEDTLPAMFLPVTIINDGTLYLDKYYKMMLEKYPNPDDKSFEKGMLPFYVRKAGDHYVSAFPIITALLALPVYFFPLKMGMPVTWENLIFLSKVTSCLIVAFSGGFFYLLIKDKFHLDDKKSLLLTAIYLFGTINFALISQSLWQHGTTQLFIILGLYFLFDVINKDNFGLSAFLAGLFMGLSVLSRPTALLPLLMLLLLVFIKVKGLKVYLKFNSYLILGVLLNFLFFYWYNKVFYLNIGNQGYSSQIFKNWLSPFPEGFLGVWVSPSKGILIYSPVLFFSIVGFFISLKKGIVKNFEYIVFGLIVLFHTLVISLWKHWFGGYSYGYRMTSDVIPFLVLLLIPFIESVFYKKYKNLFFVFLVWSVFMQFFGIVFFDGIWHSAYDLGYKNTSWLWSVKDSEFVFNVRRILVKLKLLDKACPQCL